MARLLLIVLLVSSAVGLPAAGSPVAKATTTSAPGELDSTFSGNGVVVLRDGYVPRVAAAPDGGAFASNATPARWVVTKFTTRGRLDRTFSGNGRQRIDVSFLSGPEVATDRDGGLVGAGIRYRHYEARILVVRLSADGRPLRSFGSHGVARIDPFPGESEVVTGVVVQPNGRIVVGGYFSFGSEDRRSKPFLIGLTDTGQLDPLFGDGGLAVTKLGRRSSIHCLAMTSSGRLVAAGRAYPGPVGVVARWDENGSIDRTFGDHGIVAWAAARSADQAAVTAGDGVLASGWSGSDGLLVRLTGDGEVDLSFGTAGMVTLPADEFGSVEALTVQDDGSPLVVTMSDGSDADILVVRLSDDGRPDPAFGVDGTARIVRTGGDTPTDASLAVSEKLLITGWTHPAGRRKTLVARVLT